MLDETNRPEARIISIGPSTTEEAKKAGLEVYDTAAEYTAAGIAEAILADRLKELR